MNNEMYVRSDNKDHNLYELAELAEFALNMPSEDYQRIKKEMLNDLGASDNKDVEHLVRIFFDATDH